MYIRIYVYSAKSISILIKIPWGWAPPQLPFPLQDFGSREHGGLRQAWKLAISMSLYLCNCNLLHLFKQPVSYVYIYIYMYIYMYKYI